MFWNFGSKRVSISEQFFLKLEKALMVLKFRAFINTIV